VALALAISNLKEKAAIGEIPNVYTIVETLLGPGKVVAL